MILSNVLNYVAPKGYGIIYGYYFNCVLIYVGSTKYTIGKRAGMFGKRYVSSKYASKLGEMILRYGWENPKFSVEVLETVPLAELTKRENELIDEYDLINNGCNLYHACADEEDEDEYTTRINGYKENVYHDDNLRGDVRIGTIHDRQLALNLIDRNILKDFYISPSHGNKETNNPLTFFDANNKHTTVVKYLREYWLKEYAADYNISQDLTKAESRDDYRREVVLVNPVGKSYKKVRLNDFMAEHNL